MRIFNFLALVLPLFLTISSCSKRELVKPDSASTMHYLRFEGSERSVRVKTLENGDFIHVGGANDDAFAMVVSPAGEVKWYKSYGGSKTDRFNDVTVMPSGELVAVGYSHSHSQHGEIEAYVVKMTTTGDIIWERYYTYGKSSKLYCVVALGDGAIMAGGGVAPSDEDTWVIKINGDGNTMWNRKYPNGPWHDLAITAELGPRGNVIFSGPTSPDNTSTNNRKFNTFIMKVHAKTGSRMFLNQNIEFPRVNHELKETFSWYPLEVLDDGFIWSTDRMDVDRHYHVLLVRTDLNGQALKSETFYGLGNFRIFDFQVLGDDIYVLGESWTEDDFNLKGRAYVVKLNKNFEVQWSNELGTTSQRQTAVKLSVEGDIIHVNGVIRDESEKTSYIFYQLTKDGKLIVN